MIKFALISDLHYDQWVAAGRVPNYLNWKNDDCDAIIIAGDLHNNLKQTVGVANIFSNEYPLVLFTDGNHDHYGSNILISSYESQISQFTTNKIIYINGTYIIDNVAIIGCNGWYDWNFSGHSNEIDVCKKATNDYHLIKFDLSPPELATIHMNMITDEVIRLNQNSAIKNIIIFTHTVPHENGLMKTPWEFYISNGAFYNSQMYNVLSVDNHKKISHWVYGHTHMANDFVDGYTRYICNPFGYTFEPTPAQRFGPVIIEV